MPKAGFWARFAAMLIDGLVLGVLWFLGSLVVIAGPKDTEPCSVDSSGDVVFDGGTRTLCEVPSGGAWALAAVLWLAALAATLAYYGILEGKKGQTLGKQALAIRTVDQYSGQPIGPGRAIGRYFAKILSGMVCYLGYLWMLWDPQRQTWHDKIVSSVVVRS